MATTRKMWKCANSQCKNEKGKHRGYKKVYLGEKSVSCKHCHQEMKLSKTVTTRIMRNGQTFTKALPTKGEADAHLAACITARYSGALIPGEEKLISWSEAKKLFEAELDQRLANGKSKYTDRSYRAQLKLLTNKFGRRMLQDIEKWEVEEWRDEQGKKCGPSYINSLLAMINMVYKAVLNKYSARKFPRLQETASDLARVKGRDNPKGRDNILETDEQIKALLDECHTFNLYHFCYCILNTGLRHRDVVKLKRSEIDFVRNEINTIVKGGKPVRIPLTDDYKLYLQKWILRTRPTSEGWLFPSERKLDSRVLDKVDFGFCRMKLRVAKKYEQAGDKATAEKFRKLVPHDLRHTFATHFLYKASPELGATAAVHILSQTLGHSTTYITQRYSHALDSINQAAMKAYGKQMWGVTENQSD